jgi:glycosyltransferase involved in cell wall biosynthesis
VRVLYYCPEYYYRHGGSTHARGFFGALQGLPSVSHSFLYPGSTPRKNFTDTTEQQTTGGRLWYFPASVRKIIRFFKPRRELTNAIIHELATKRCDVLIIRTGVKQPSISRLKKACPGITICLEINSAYFDESFSRLPLRATFQKLEVMRFNHADAIVVVSSYLKTYLDKRGIAPEKILVNQNGVNTEAIDLAVVQDVKKDYGIPANAFVIGYIGGMEPFRRLPEVIGYMAKLRQSGNDDFYFLVVGDGKDMPEIRAAIEVEHDALDGAVKLAGWQEQARLPRFLKTFDVAIFPFTNDYCSPLKLFEYLGAGVPTVGPDTSTVREVFEDGVHLRLIKQDGSNFASTVLELRNNPQLRARMANAGKELVLNEYTWEKNAERVISHIEHVRHRWQAAPS